MTVKSVATLSLAPQRSKPPIGQTQTSAYRANPSDQPQAQRGIDASYDSACLLQVARTLSITFTGVVRGRSLSPADRGLVLPSNWKASSQDELYNLLVEALSEINNDYQRGYMLQQADNEGYVEQAKNLSAEGKKWLQTYRLVDHSFLVYGIRGSLVSELTTRLGSALQLKQPQIL